ncbi:MAG TPA: protein kinase [Thermoanaerobaculia bacterium]|nr:protein kinase [Thermoanaerobaculia bacterium]
MIGSTLSHYKILDKIGQGGMGEVYLAEDLNLGRRVALKVLPQEMAERPERLRRFQREAKVVASLNHPNIVTLYSVEEVEGLTFITMELVEGRSLEQAIRTDGLPVEDFLEIAVPLVEALAAAHERGITHRDLKPANVMLGGDGRLKVLDFGLAKLHEESSPGDDATLAYTAGLTQAGMVLGTVPYMAPEQVSGRTADHRSDIFALGVIFYELLTGQRPFRGDSSAELISSILRDRPAEVHEMRVDLPSYLGRVVRRCLEKDPDRRFQGARDLRLELDEVAREAKKREAKPAPAVAVLPFVDMSPEKDQDYFCEGIAEELINGLGRIENLRVASRTSSFQFKGTTADIREIGRRLQVGSVLEGSVRKAGNRLRITAQLVDVQDGYRLWSDRFDRDMKDIFAIQDEIAESIVAALQVTLSPKERRAIQNVSTRDVEAYDYYLRGRKFFYELSERGFRYARQLYARAIELDPSYALAYAGMADCCSFSYMYTESTEANRIDADENSRKALELDPDLAEAHASRGLALTITKDYHGAKAAFETAVRLNPRLYEAYYFHARNCMAQGDYAGAAELFGKAGEVRPDDYQAPALRIQALASLGASEEERRAAARKAIEVAERHLELNPDDVRALYLGAAVVIDFDRERGLEWARRALAVDPDEAVILYNVACVMAKAGEHQEAIDLLEKAVASGFGYKEWIEHDSDFIPLRDDPRFQQLLESM